MDKAPNKGPQGKDDEGDGPDSLIGCQEEYEGGQHVGVTDIPGLEPFSLRAPEGDHTPNFTKEPKREKAEYGKFYSGRYSWRYCKGGDKFIIFSKNCCRQI